MVLGDPVKGLLDPKGVMTYRLKTAALVQEPELNPSLEKLPVCVGVRSELPLSSIYLSTYLPIICLSVYLSFSLSIYKSIRVCEQACVYVCVHEPWEKCGSQTCVHAYMFVHTNHDTPVEAWCVHVCVHVCTGTIIHMWKPDMYMCVCTCIHMYACGYMYMCVCRVRIYLPWNARGEWHWVLVVAFHIVWDRVSPLSASGSLGLMMFEQLQILLSVPPISS